MKKIKALFYFNGYEEEVEIEILSDMNFQEYYPIVEEFFQKWLKGRPEQYMINPSWTIV